MNNANDITVTVILPSMQTIKRSFVAMEREFNNNNF